MSIRFVLGAAGQGKTALFLEEIRRELLRAPEGAPLIFIAPKQATFQIERELLTSRLEGYTRLHILSFERLAQFVLDELAQPLEPFLEESGRLMVLRALLARFTQSNSAGVDRLKLFHATAHLPGFAQELNLLFRELARAGTSPRAILERIKQPLPTELAAKLADIDLLWTAYTEWLKEHALRDADTLLDVAASALLEARSQSGTPIQIAGLWLDGFAEMTDQELRFLEALMPSVDGAALAFCLDAVLEQTPAWFSPWAVVGSTFQRCRARLLRYRPEIVMLPRGSLFHRFAGNPALAHLEAHWARPVPMTEMQPPGAVRLVECTDPETEAVFAARTILHFIRTGNRYRECALILRTLEGYHAAIARVFQRYEIPFFVDRREPVAHHPLAELTRNALRTLSHGWQHEDWFGVLKSGLAGVPDDTVDWLENLALEHGWQGHVWQETPAPEKPPVLPPVARIALTRILAAFQPLAESLRPSGQRPSGLELAAALREFWRALAVEETLERWSEEENSHGLSQRVHETVWDQMNAWLTNVELAFAHQSHSLRQWLPILEAALGQMTVGVVPPALDQVVIGTIDRSRNPDLKLVLILGVNEHQFPAPPAEPRLLTERDREELEKQNVRLGVAVPDQIGHERYYGYIACTRARGQVILTCATRDAADGALNPSPFFIHLERLFPTLLRERFSLPVPDDAIEHRSELVRKLLSQRADNQLATATDWLAPVGGFQFLPQLEEVPTLDPKLAERLYGKNLRTSISRLQEYAACPFRFFIRAGLKAEERKTFEPDARELGSFQHEALAQFHQRIRSTGRHWRDLTPGEAGQLMREVAAGISAQFREGLLAQDLQAQFKTRALVQSLERFAAATVSSMPHHQFDPTHVELDFGFEESKGLPAWSLDLGNEHHLHFNGRIDRIDLCHDPATGEALCLVIDYKSSRKPFVDEELRHGLELQLPAYLAFLRESEAGPDFFQVKRLQPGGIFYVTLKADAAKADTRREAQAAEMGTPTFGHEGRFSRNFLHRLRNENAPTESAPFGVKARLTAVSKGPQDHEAFEQMLSSVRTHLVRMGQEIYQGRIAIDPYQLGSRVACDRCDYSAICRIDPWTHPFRRLDAGSENSSASEE